MKHLYKLSIIFLIFISACTDKFEDFNTDVKHPAVVTGEALFSNAEKSLSDQVNSTNVNRNIFKLMSQYWTETQYIDEANYDLINRNIPQNIWRYFYRRTLTDLKEASSIISETEVLASQEIEKQNKLYIIEILNVYIYQRLVDIFGMVPYSQSLDIENVYPVYEKGEDIYKDLFTRLDAAINGLDASEGSFGDADLFYGGSVSSWIKFANTLKVRMGITIADFDETLAKTAVEEGVKGCFTSAADNCLFSYATSAPNYSPLYEDLVASDRDDFIPANTFVNAMQGLDDPRLTSYFNNPVVFPFPTDKEGNKLDSVVTADVVAGIRFTDENGIEEYRVAPFTMSAANDTKLTYINGGKYGYGASYAAYSHIADRIKEPTFEGIILTYSELQFYLAEAAARGFNVTNSAEEYYNEGIKASFTFWGTEGVDDYLQSPKVAYATAEGDWKQKIAIQSWLASYTRGLVGYNTWRRLDYPILNIPQNVESYDDIPVRFTFPVNEQTLNDVNWKAASDAIGGDLISTKVFWDIN